MTSQRHEGTLIFRLYRPRARRVALAGDFNGWDANSLLMKPRGGGWWTCRVRLAPGVYQFRYCADGEWLPDYAAFGLTPGPFGWNSVVCVDSTPLQDEEADRDNACERGCLAACR